MATVKYSSAASGSPVFGLESAQAGRQVVESPHADPLFGDRPVRGRSRSLGARLVRDRQRGDAVLQPADGDRHTPAVLDLRHTWCRRHWVRR